MVRARSCWISAIDEGVTAAGTVDAHPFELPSEQHSKPFRASLPDVVLVQPAELVVVEGGGGAVHVGDVEPRNHLLT